MNSKKTVIRLLVVSAIVLSLLCLLVIGWEIAVERAVKNQLCLIGNKLTGREIEVGPASYSIFSWNMDIAYFKVKNPIGYSPSNQAIEARQIRISIAPWAIMSRVVHIRKLHIAEVELYPELRKIPFTFQDWIVLLINPEINLVDFSAVGKQAAGTADPQLWFLKIDDFTIPRAEVYFVNISKFKKILPPICQDLLPNKLPLKEYRQLNLGADGKHTGPMIASEILDRHLGELKQWYSQWYNAKKDEIKAAFKKFYSPKNR